MVCTLYLTENLKKKMGTTVTHKTHFFPNSAFPVQELLPKVLNTITLGKHGNLDPDKFSFKEHLMWIFRSFYLVHLMNILSRIFAYRKVPPIFLELI